MGWHTLLAGASAAAAYLGGKRATAIKTTPLSPLFRMCQGNAPHSRAGGESRRAAAPRSARGWRHPDETRRETDRRGWGGGRRAPVTGDAGSEWRTSKLKPETREGQPRQALREDPGNTNSLGSAG